MKLTLSTVPGDADAAADAWADPDRV